MSEPGSYDSFKVSAMSQAGGGGEGGGGGVIGMAVGDASQMGAGLSLSHGAIIKGNPYGLMSSFGQGKPNPLRKLLQDMGFTTNAGFSMAGNVTEASHEQIYGTASDGGSAASGDYSGGGGDASGGGGEAFTAAGAEAPVMHHYNVSHVGDVSGASLSGWGSISAPATPGMGESQEQGMGL